MDERVKLVNCSVCGDVKHVTGTRQLKGYSSVMGKGRQELACGIISGEDLTELVRNWIVPVLSCLRCEKQTPI
jgi:hypothetical protein